MISPFQTVLITRLSTNNRNKKGFTHIFAVTPEKAIITTLLYKSYKTFLCVRFRSPNWIYCNWLSFGIRWQLGCLCLLIVKNGIVYERVSKRLFHVCFDVYFFSLDTFLFIMFLFFSPLRLQLLPNGNGFILYDKLIMNWGACGEK